MFEKNFFAPFSRLASVQYDWKQGFTKLAFPPECARGGVEALREGEPASGIRGHRSRGQPERDCEASSGGVSQAGGLRPPDRRGCQIGQAGSSLRTFAAGKRRATVYNYNETIGTRLSWERSPSGKRTRQRSSWPFTSMVRHLPAHSGTRLPQIRAWNSASNDSSRGRRANSAD